MENIVERITELRKKKGWSQYELAKQTGIAPNTVYLWARTGAVPSLANIERICEAMDISVAQFFSNIHSPDLSDEENVLLQEWFALSPIEKAAIFAVIDVFKSLKF